MALCGIIAMILSWQSVYSLSNPLKRKSIDHQTGCVTLLATIALFAWMALQKPTWVSAYISNLTLSNLQILIIAFLIITVTGLNAYFATRPTNARYPINATLTPNPWLTRSAFAGLSVLCGLAGIDLVLQHGSYLHPIAWHLLVMAALCARLAYQLKQPGSHTISKLLACLSITITIGLGVGLSADHAHWLKNMIQPLLNVGLSTQIITLSAIVIIILCLGLLLNQSLQSPNPLITESNPPHNRHRSSIDALNQGNYPVIRRDTPIVIGQPVRQDANRGVEEPLVMGTRIA